MTAPASQATMSSLLMLMLHTASTPRPLMTHTGRDNRTPHSTHTSEDRANAAPEEAEVAPPDSLGQLVVGMQGFAQPWLGEVLVLGNLTQQQAHQDEPLADSHSEPQSTVWGLQDRCSCRYHTNCIQQLQLLYAAITSAAYVNTDNICVGILRSVY